MTHDKGNNEIADIMQSFLWLVDKSKVAKNQ